MHTSNSDFISVDKVSMSFGQTEAVRDVSMKVAKGTIFGLRARMGPGNPPCSG